MQLDMNNSIADDAEIGEERKTVLAKIIIVAKGFVVYHKGVNEAADLCNDLDRRLVLFLINSRV